eukprot:g27825.t1
MGLRNHFFFRSYTAEDIYRLNEAIFNLPEEDKKHTFSFFDANTTGLLFKAVQKIKKAYSAGKCDKDPNFYYDYVALLATMQNQHFFSQKQTKLLLDWLHEVVKAPPGEDKNATAGQTLLKELTAAVSILQGFKLPKSFSTGDKPTGSTSKRKRRGKGSGGGGGDKPLDRLKLVCQGFTKGFSTPVVDQEAPPAEIEEQSGPSTNMFSSWAEKARKAFNEVTYDPVPKEETPEAIPDEEKGEGAWANFSKAASRLSKSVASAAEEAKQNLEKAAEKAKSADLAQQVQDFQSGVAKGLGAAADRASQAREVFAERGKAASAIAKDLGSKAANKATEVKSHAASKAKEAKAGRRSDGRLKEECAAKDKLAQAGEGLKGLGNLALSPAKLAQFAGTFLAGVFLISLSLNFLPVMVIAPQKFALLFAFGSMTMLGSFALLKGPKAFLSGMARKEQLPFSVAYGVGLVGTLVATIILRSFLLTGICGLLQAVGLLYFVASYVPGGKACVNFVGRMCSKATTAFIGFFLAPPFSRRYPDMPWHFKGLNGWHEDFHLTVALADLAFIMMAYDVLQAAE